MAKEKIAHLPILQTVTLQSKREVPHASGDISVICQISGHEYEGVITKSYARIVNQPFRRARKIFSGQQKIRSNPSASLAFLVPMQANGKCSANCSGCRFASRMNKEDAGIPVTAGVMRVLLEEMVNSWKNAHPGVALPGLSISNVMAGDMCFNRHTTEVLTCQRTFPGVKKVRASTIAQRKDSTTNPFLAFMDAVRESDIKQGWRMQVSLHDIDPMGRLLYIAGSSDHPLEDIRKISVYSTREIAKYAQEIKRLTGNNLTLTFTCNAGTKKALKIEGLETMGLGPDLVDLQLRNTVLTGQKQLFEEQPPGPHLRPMPIYEFDALYQRARARGYNVVVMVASPEAAEQKKHVIAKVRRRVRDVIPE